MCLTSRILAEFRYFFGMKVAYSKEGIFLSQRKYTMDLLEETEMLGGRVASTPLEAKLKLGYNDSLMVDRRRYQSVEYIEAST